MLPFSNVFEMISPFHIVQFCIVALGLTTIYSTVEAVHRRFDHQGLTTVQLHEKQGIEMAAQVQRDWEEYHQPGKENGLKLSRLWTKYTAPN